MNYAEDRLDRKARMSNITDGNMNDEVGSKIPSSSRFASDANTRNGLVRDLQRAHSLLRSGGGDAVSAYPVAAGRDDNFGMEEAEEKQNGFHTPKARKGGHELAGRTLRDCGSCRHATFHYGMAWLCDVDDWKCADQLITHKWQNLPVIPNLVF